MEKKLFMIPFEHYNDEVLNIVSESAGKSKKVCYITVNKTYLGVKEFLQKKKLNMDNFYFLDSITPRLFQLNPKGNCTFIKSLQDLSKLADLILNTVKMNKIELVILDSLSALLVYKSDKDVISFTEYLISFLEELDVSIILFALSEDKSNPSIKQIKMGMHESKSL